MPYAPSAEALNLPALDLDALCREQGPAPWRKVLVAHDGGRWALIHWPAGFASVPHYHPRAVEVFYILRGRAVFRFGDEDTDRAAEPGTLLMAPKGLLHAIAVPGPEPLLFLAQVSPNEDAPDETVEEPTAPRPNVRA